MDPATKMPVIKHWNESLEIAEPPVEKLGPVVQKNPMLSQTGLLPWYQEESNLYRQRDIFTSPGGSSSSSSGGPN